jgi:hypothetical protein
MLTMEEQQKLKKLLELLYDEKGERNSSIDVSGRLRDEKGRFRPSSDRQVEESKYESGREIKLVKVKGSYGTYLVKTKWLSDGEMNLLLIAGILFLLALIF